MLKYQSIFKFDYIEEYSHNKKVKDWVVDKKFDLTLIDGDHSYIFCKNDFDLIKDKSKIVALHDINMFEGVEKVWIDEQMNYKTKVSFNEQYRSNPVQGYKKHLGIGVLNERIS